MQILYTALALFLLLNIAAGLWRILRGPTAADRMLSVQLMGTASVALLLIMAEILGNRALQDVALLFALLSAVAAVAFVRYAPSEKEAEYDPE
ncbi:MAG: monovalent cation/H+ antiporter complex subunit F [Campylobacterales bacterium]|jgi:multicomponent Na+:H+ antiporter subunit F